MFNMPWTFVVAALCAAMAAFLATISAASASTRFLRWFAIEGIGRGPGTGAAAS